MQARDAEATRSAEGRLQRAAQVRQEQVGASSDMGSFTSLRPNPGHSTIC